MLCIAVHNVSLLSPDSTKLVTTGSSLVRGSTLELQRPSALFYTLALATRNVISHLAKKLRPSHFLTQTPRHINKDRPTGAREFLGALIIGAIRHRGPTGRCHLHHQTRVLRLLWLCLYLTRNPNSGCDISGQRNRSCAYTRH